MTGTESAGTPPALPARIRTRLATALGVSRGVLRRRGSAAVLVGVTVLYLFAFLYMLDDILLRPGAGLSMAVVDEPLSRMFEPSPGAFLFRPVALFELGAVVWEFSPLNTLLGLGVASLVGLNLAISYLALSQPRSCGMSAGAGVFASVPALLAGSACCAPVLFLLLGIQASGILLSAFTFLLPVSVLLLLVTLVYVAGKIEPSAL